MRVLEQTPMVYEGLLKTVSGGNVVTSPDSGYWTHNMGISRFHQTNRDIQSGYTRREFVDIGDTRLKGVLLSPLYDALLLEAIGKEIAVSVVGPTRGRTTVVALRTPDGGLNKPPLARLLLGMVKGLITTVIAAVLVAALMTLVGGIVVSILTGSYDVGARWAPWIGVGLGAWIVFGEVRRFARGLRARAALS
jgi:hypothetical protein